MTDRSNAKAHGTRARILEAVRGASAVARAPRTTYRRATTPTCCR